MNTVQLDIHKDLIEASKKGHAKSQYKLYSQYARAMFNIAYRMMNNKEDAEDLLQDAFSDAFRRLNSFRYESTFGAWLKTIVINKCLNEINRRKTPLDFFEDIQKFERNQNQEEDELPDTVLQLGRVKEAMEQLPNGSRMIFNLYLLEGYDHVEISEILNISVSNSKSQYMRAKNRIKELLKERYYEER